MRHILLCVVCVTLACGICLAGPRTRDWQSVRDMPPGWRITVIAGHNYPCIFVRATADELICGRLQHGWLVPDPPELHFPRNTIREIKLDRGDDANALAGAAVGGATGATFGAIAVRNARGTAALLFGAIGAGFGARLGQDVHILRGKVIYCSSPAPRARSR
jgi:hypothetical protein